MKLWSPKKLAVSFLLSSGFVQNMAAQAQTQAPIDLRQASLEDLMDITVTSGPKEEKLSKTAAAVFVITQGALAELQLSHNEEKNPYPDERVTVHPIPAPVPDALSEACAVK